MRLTDLLDTIGALRAERDAVTVQRDEAEARAEEAEARNTEVREWVEGQFEEYDGDPVEEDDYIAGTMEGARDICRGVLERLRGESAPDPQPAPCETCSDQREVCRLCGPMPRGATCLDHHHDEGVPCPSCSASPGGEAP